MASSTAARPLMSHQPSRTLAAIRKHKVMAEASGHLQEAQTNGLRKNALPFVETLAQSVANIAPTATPSLTIPDALAIPIEAQMNTAIYEHCADIPAISAPLLRACPQGLTGELTPSPVERERTSGAPPNWRGNEPCAALRQAGETPGVPVRYMPQMRPSLWADGRRY